jgi:hypothetical protein
MEGDYDLSLDIGYYEATLEEKYMALLLSNEFPLQVSIGKF